MAFVLKYNKFILYNVINRFNTEPKLCTQNWHNFLFNSKNIPVFAIVFGGGTWANTTGKIELSIWLSICKSFILAWICDV